MTDNPNRPARRSPRLQGYDYAQSGAYFVTICTHDRSWCFGKVMNGEMSLNAVGMIAEAEWYQTATIRQNVELDAFIVMPNHVHAIIVITASRDTVGTGRALSDGRALSAPSGVGKSSAGSLSTIVGAYKSAVTKRVNLARNTPGAPLWQARYHDHIIRNETDLNRIREYVLNNPARWAEDTFFHAE